MSATHRQRADGINVALGITCATCAGPVEVTNATDPTPRSWIAEVACYRCRTEDRLCVRLEPYRELDPQAMRRADR